MTALRVVLVCPYSFTRPGGVQGQVAGLARSLRRAGHEVAVVSPGRDPGPTSSAPAWSGGPPSATGVFDGDHRVSGVVTLRSNGSSVPLTVSPRAAQWLERFVRHQSADLVHLHEPMAPILGYGCLLTHPAPLVGTYHRSGASRWYRALRPLARWANSRLDRRCAVSEAARETARSAMGGDVEVLFNGVEVDRFASPDPWVTTTPTVLFLGRHEPRKGLEVLLEGFSRVPGPATLWIAGDGPDTARLRRRHPPSDRLEWLGVLSEEEVARRLAGADVLCAPSLFGESFGMVMLEAMAARCVVVASDIPGYRAAAGGHALLVKPGDAAAMSTVLTAALADAEAGTGRAAPSALEAGVAHAERWSMDRLARRYLELYRAVVQR